MSNGYKAYDAGMLSDVDIREFWGKGIEIYTAEKGALKFDLDKQLKFGSIDLRFQYEYKKISVNKNSTIKYDTMTHQCYTTLHELGTDEKLILEPGEVVLTTTLEVVRLSEEFAGIITGRSSIARLGIMVHCCQEFINPGHGQPIPLQLINLSPNTVELDMSIPICQLIIFKLRTPSSGRYKECAQSKYANELTPMESKVYEELQEIHQREDGNKSEKKEQTAEKLNTDFVPKSSEKNLKYKEKLNKYVAPFLPSVIMALLISPLLKDYINGKTVLDLLLQLQKVPVTMILVGAIVVLYIWLKKE